MSENMILILEGDFIDINSIRNKYADWIFNYWHEGTNIALEIYYPQDLSQMEFYNIIYRKENIKPLSMYQLRLHLLNIDKLNVIETMVSTSEKNIQIEWNFATQVKWDSALIAEISNILNLDDMDLFNFMRDAHKL